jgi:hypothetical protein
MIPSIPGVLVMLAVLLVGYLLGSAALIGLFISMPFAATAFGALPALGGSSPLIYTFFAMLLIMSVALRRTFFREVGEVLAQQPTAWVVLFLAFYTVVGSFVLPRLFMGETMAIVATPKAVLALPLAPVSGNVTQTAYFLLGVLTFCSCMIIFKQIEAIEAVRRGFFALVITHLALGLIDLGGKLAGLGDVLAFIRTASYSLLTEVEEGGFWRIVGGASEASTYGAMSVMCLAFTFTYWRSTKSQLALVLSLVLFVILIFSTSSTAYVGLAALIAPLLISIGWDFVRGRLSSDDMLIFALAAIGLFVILGLFVVNDQLLEPLIRLIDAMVFQKASSGSGVERMYWNTVAFQSFFDTFGMGIGMGSGRSSSWAISVLSQFGVIGAAMMGYLVYDIARGLRPYRTDDAPPEVVGLVNGARASALAALVVGSVGGSGADPGILFFVSLAVVLSCRSHVARAVVARQRELIVANA